MCSFHPAYTLAVENQIDLTELSIEELMNIPVYGVSRFEQKQTEAPSFVTIITADTIRKHGYRNLSDILTGISSFVVSSDRNYSYIGVRGFGRTGDYNSRILILINYHRINENIYNSFDPGNGFPLDVDVIDRVEVIRGPGSSLYGSDAFFGVVNIITKHGDHIGGVEASGSAGTFQTYKTRLTYGSSFNNGFDGLVSGSYFSTRGDDRLYYSVFDDPATNNGIAEDNDREKAHNLFAKFSYKGFTLTGASVSRTKRIPTASFGLDFNASQNETADDQGYLDLLYERNIGDDLKLLSRIYLDRYEYKGSYLYSGILNKDIATGTWWGGEIQVRTTFSGGHTIIAGADYVDNIKQDQENYDEDPSLLYINDSRSSKRWALFTQGDFWLSSNFHANLGIRHDHYSTFGNTTNPRASLLYSPWEQTTFKLVYGTAFRSPNTYEMFYAVPIYAQKGNPDLQPEKIRTWELIWEQGINNNLAITVSGFHSGITNLINQVEDPSDGQLVFINSEEVTSKGIELEFKGAWENGTRARVGYTYQESKYSENDCDLVNSPHHRATVNLIVPIPIKDEKLFGGIEVQYTGRRETIGGDTLEGYLVTNLTLFGQKLLRGLDLSGSVYNLFDKTYSDPAGEEHEMDSIAHDGRSFMAKVTYTF
jgi:iron complex outermembrane receptor protein